MPWGVVAAAVVGAVVSSDSARKASNTQKDANDAALRAQMSVEDRNYLDQEPYRVAGQTALGQLAEENGKMPTASDVMSDPGYQFGLDQGQKGIDRKAAAGGGRVSGAALKAAGEYATNYATTGYNAAYQRRQDRLNRLAALAGIGQTSTAASASSASNSANRISDLLTAQGNAAGAGTLAQGNIWANTGNQLAAAGQRWASSPSSDTTNSYGVDSGNGAGTNYTGGTNDASYWQ